MLLRIILVIVVVGLIIGGYFFIDDRIEAAREEEYRKFGGLIAEVSIAAELYRNNQDSFFVARDSILKQYGLTEDDLSRFREKLTNDRKAWLRVFEEASEATDSLVLRWLSGSDSAFTAGKKAYAPPNNLIDSNLLRK